MAAAAGEQRPLALALAATLEDLELKEQRTALKSFLKKGRCVQSFADQPRQKLNLSTSVALAGCSAILLRAEGI